MPIAIVSCGIHNGVASVAVETSLKSHDWYTRRIEYHANSAASTEPAPSAHSSSACRARPCRRSTTSVTRMCSPRLSVCASARKPADAIA